MTRRQLATRGEVTACHSELIGQAAVDPVALASSSDPRLKLPGMYAWWVNDNGAKQLSAGLGHSIAEGLIYSGQTGATKWPSGKRGSGTLRSRLVSQHSKGRITGSTFRLTLAAILADQSLVKSGPGATNSGMQRGDPGRKDVYSFALISLNIRLNKKPNNCWG